MKKWWSGITLVAILAVAALTQRFRQDNDEVVEAGPCGQNLETIARAVERYAGRHGGRPPALMEQLLPDYLSAVPVCSVSRRPSYALFAGFSAPWGQGRPDNYYVFCHGRHPDLQLHYPAYSKELGMLTGPPPKTKHSRGARRR